MQHQGIEEHLRGYPKHFLKCPGFTKTYPLSAQTGFYTKPKKYFNSALCDTFQYRAIILKKKDNTMRDWAILLSRACNTFQVLYDTSSKGVQYWKVLHGKTPRGVRHN